MESESLWKFYRNEVNDAVNKNNADSYSCKKNNNKTTKSKRRLSIGQK